MRLLHTTSLEFKEFFDNQIPEYAILSHRWGDQEVSYRQFQDGTPKKGEGYDKIMKSCKKARHDQFNWIWIDTCCIDKTSSAELSEAINSMFQWYYQSKECYVYLNDVVWVEQDDGNGQMTGSPASRAMLRNSAWHTRGWTLQELLAPANVIFYDRDWKSMGRKDDLAVDISDATGIDIDFMASRSSLSAACIAERMSWASKRKTSRVEDMAYSLLGIFNVNLPLMYGEGEKAFLRLQKEIIKESDDESIFAWTFPLSYSGLLAPSPAAFANSSNIVPLHWEENDKRRPYAMTNKGLEVHYSDADLTHGRHAISMGKPTKKADDICLSLNCARLRADKVPRRISILLSKISSGWSRIECDELQLEAPSKAGQKQNPQNKTIHVRQVQHSEDGLGWGWEERRTSAGKVYYVHHETRTTSWINPRIAEWWEERQTASGRAYYLDHRNMSTSWVHPLTGVESELPKTLKMPMRTRESPRYLDGD